MNCYSIEPPIEVYVRQCLFLVTYYHYKFSKDEEDTKAVREIISQNININKQFQKNRKYKEEKRTCNGKILKLKRCTIK